MLFYESNKYMKVTYSIKTLKPIKTFISEKKEEIKITNFLNTQVLNASTKSNLLVEKDRVVILSSVPDSSLVEEWLMSYEVFSSTNLSFISSHWPFYNYDRKIASSIQIFKTPYKKPFVYAKKFIDKHPFTNNEPSPIYSKLLVVKLGLFGSYWEKLIRRKKRHITFKK